MNKLLLQLTIIAQDSIPAEQNPLCQIQQFTERTADYNGTIIDPFVIDDTENLYCMQRIEPVVITDSYGDEELKTEEYLLADYITYTVNGLCGVMHRYVLYDIHGKLVDY